jgi:hypothetical protein
MKIKTIDTYKLSLLASAALVYLLATNSLHWLTYVLVAVIVLERAFIAFVMWMATRIQKELATKLMGAIAEAQKTGMPIQPPFDQENQ